ncbi:MAG: hypothetical protein HYY06_04010 [Deltaproteobacteria bacterium]|nr:hypothetical protein [Deltaproteobacteria bacterium]
MSPSRSWPAALSLLIASSCSDPDGGGRLPDASIEPGADAATDAAPADAAPLDASPDARPDAGGDAGPDMAAAFAAIDGMAVLEVGRAGEYQSFELAYVQPVDHGAPEGPSFEQHMTLLHRSSEAPMVLVATGYDNYLGGRLEDITYRLSANQVVIEKRYHGESRPAEVDWTTLTQEQIANDAHRLTEALESIYSGAWIGTGRSMGGADSVYHRRFFPDDVAGTVAYASAFLLGYPDTRFAGFFDEAVDADCEAALEAVQVEILGARRPAMLELAAKGNAYAYERSGGMEPALETSVLSLPWVFWQYRGIDSCPMVPDAGTAGDEDLFAFHQTVTGAWTASDEWWSYFEAYYYQIQAELGAPVIPADHLEGLVDPDVVDIEEGLIPVDADPPVFDAAFVPESLAWLEEEGHDIVFIYGELDPWTASRPDVAGVAEVWSFTAPAENHGVEIGDLDPEDAAVVEGLLEAWGGGE